MSVKSKELFNLILLEILILFAYYLLTNWGIGLTPDSLSYMRMSDILGKMFAREQYQLYSYFFHFPPLLPLLLSLSRILGVNSLVFARIYGAIILSIDIALFYMLVKRKSGSNIFSLSITLVFFLIFMRQFSVLLSEPLFYMFILLFIWSIELDIWEVVVFLIILFASLVRYAGVSLAATYFIYSILFKDGWRRFSGIALSIVSQVPLFLYLSRAPSGERTFSLKTAGIGSFFIKLLLVPFKLLLPYLEVIKLNISKMILYPVIILVIGFLVLYPVYKCCAQREKVSEIYKDYTIRVVIIFMLIYFAVVIFSRLFFDAYIPPDVRIFSPLTLGALYLFASVCRSIVRMYYKRLYVYVVLLIFTSIVYGYDVYKDGVMYSSRRWKKSDVLVYIKNSSSKPKCVLSNVPEAISLYTDLKSQFLPRYYSPVRGRKNPRWKWTLRRILSDYGQCAIVYFTDIGYRWYIVPPDSFLRYVAVVDSVQFDDGTIYYVK